MSSRLALLRRVEGLRQRRRDLAARTHAETERTELAEREAREGLETTAAEHQDAIQEVAASLGIAGLELWQVERQWLQASIAEQRTRETAAAQKTAASRVVLAERTRELERIKRVKEGALDERRAREQVEEQHAQDDRASRLAGTGGRTS